MASDYEVLKEMVERAGLDLRDTESGLPRRHFIELPRDQPEVVFRFEPDGSLNEVYSLRPREVPGRSGIAGYIKK